MEEQFDLIKHGMPWSYSKITKLETCPYQFYLSEIEKWHSMSKVNVKAIQGITIHKFLDRVYRGEHQIEDLMPFLMKERIPEYFKTNILKKFQNIKSLYHKVNKEITKILGKDIRLTSEFSIKLDKNFDKCKEDVVPMYKGILDVVSKNDDTLVMIDHKSSAADISRFDKQMDFYNLLLAFRFPKIKTIHTYINDIGSLELKPMKVCKCETLVTEGKEKFISYFNNLVSKYKSKKVEEYPTVESSLCGFCTFSDICPRILEKKVAENS